MRLNRVRVELMRNQKFNKISDIANKWGFWHMGQFAHDYHKLFNEKPSQTNGRKFKN